MKFSIQVNRGYILDIINLVDENNLVINLIAQSPTNNNLININLDLVDGANKQDIKNFIKGISKCTSINSYKMI